MTITIDTIGRTDLHLHYPGQTRRQPCHVELDIRGDGELTAEADPEIGGAYPMAVGHGLVLRWTIPALCGDAANDLLQRLAPLAQRVVDGSDEEWDGSNRVGKLNDDARAAVEEIEAICDHVDGSEIVVWKAEDWYEPLASAKLRGDARLADIGQDLGITATTTDEELSAIEDAEEAKAIGEGVDGIEGLGNYLTTLRDAAARLAAEQAEEAAAE